MDYIHLTTSGELPDATALRPFKTVVIAEDTVTPERQAAISQWLVASGCLYMMAWGHDCSSWAESVALANRQAFDTDEIPNASLVMTTWHADETLQETFWFSKHTAMHPCASLENIVLLHMAEVGREQEMIAAYQDA